jgi:hypothetical protein
MRKGDSYGALLVLIVATYVVMAVLDRGPWSLFFVSVMLGCVLLLALHTSHVRERAFRIATIATVIVVTSTFIQAVIGRHAKDGTTFVMFLIVVVAPVAILNRIVRHRVIGLETILGAVCVYVLLGIAFAGVYAGIDNIDSGKFFVQRAANDTVDFLYFSFVVLTTVGFGDLTPRLAVGRVTVTIEALMGQVFLVTLVARLMSLYGMERRGAPAGEADTPDDRGAEPDAVDTGSATDPAAPGGSVLEE